MARKASSIASNVRWYSCCEHPNPHNWSELCVLSMLATRVEPPVVRPRTAAGPDAGDAVVRPCRQQAAVAVPVQRRDVLALLVLVRLVRQRRRQRQPAPAAQVPDARRRVAGAGRTERTESVSSGRAYFALLRAADMICGQTARYATCKAQCCDHVASTRCSARAVAQPGLALLSKVTPRRHRLLCRTQKA